MSEDEERAVTKAQMVAWLLDDNADRWWGMMNTNNHMGARDADEGLADDLLEAFVVVPR